MKQACPVTLQGGVLSLYKRLLYKERTMKQSTFLHNWHAACRHFHPQTQKVTPEPQNQPPNHEAGQSRASTGGKPVLVLDFRRSVRPVCLVRVRNLIQGNVFTTKSKVVVQSTLLTPGPNCFTAALLSRGSRDPLRSAEGGTLIRESGCCGYRGGLVFKAHRLWYHSAEGSRTL